LRGGILLLLLILLRMLRIDLGSGILLRPRRE